MITEAELIEMDRRFRAMEDVAERADLLLSAYQNPGEMMPDEHVALEEFLEVRLKLGNTMEACAADMKRLSECARKSLETVSLTTMTDTQFIPRYEGHEPPRHFAEIRQPKLCRLEVATVPATPVLMTSKELRAKTGRDARTAAANARKAACLHPTLTRVYGNDCAVRCADCKREIPVEDKTERNRLCPKAPGQVTAHYDLNGESLTIYELAARFRVDRRTIWGRMNRGAKIEDALYPSRQRRKVE